MDLHYLALILALLCFVVAAFGSRTYHVNLIAAGLALLVLSMLL